METDRSEQLDSTIVHCGRGALGVTSPAIEEQPSHQLSSGRWGKAGAKLRVVSMLQSHREVDADFAEFLQDDWSSPATK